MSTYYITLKKVRATEVNVHAGFYSTGIPALTAVCGMTHALQLRCAKLSPVADQFGFDDDDQSLSFTGTALSIVEHRVAPGPAKRKNALASDASNAALAASFAYDPLADLTFELVLEAQTDGTRGSLESFLQSENFRIALNSLRLSGGALSWNGDAKVFLNAQDAIGHLDSRGFIVQDEYVTLEDDLKSEPDVLEALIARVARPNIANRNSQKDGKPSDSTVAGESAGTGGKAEAAESDSVDSAVNEANTDAETAQDAPENVYKPIYVPLAIGFQSLTPLVVHPRAKKGYEHRFVEPVLSLGRLRLVASVKRRLKEERPGLFWAHQLPKDGAYLVRAH